MRAGRQSGTRDVKDVDITDRFQVLTAPDCNNNCLFCMESDRENRRKIVKAVSATQIKTLLEENAFRKSVMFTAGEPTSHPSFLTYLLWAKELKYKSIGVISNGRRFSHPPFVHASLRAGLTHAVISIHGDSAGLHDGLTRTPGSFNQSYAGIRNLATMKGEYRLKLHSSTVILSRNYRHMFRLFLSFAPYVDEVLFNVIQPVGRGEAHFGQLVPRYTDIAESFACFLRELNAPAPPPVFLVDLPFCTTEGMGIPNHNRGFVEQYFFMGHQEKGYEMPEAPTASDSPSDEEQGCRKGPAPLFGFGMRRRGQQLSQLKEKREACSHCRYDGLCDGVWSNYVRGYGWDEFNPVRSTD